MSKRTRRRMDNARLAPQPTDPDELAYAHRHCVSKAWMQLEYRRSNDFELCDSDGQPNPVGKFVISLKKGTIREIHGQCSFEFLSNGDKNPNWQGCPFLDSNKMRVLSPPDPKRIDAILQDMGVEGPIIVSAEISEPKKARKSPVDEELDRLERLIEQRTKK